MPTTTDLIRTRISVRAFSDRPVPEALIRDVLEVARWAPSGGNVQPWHVHVIAGPAMARFRALIAEKMAATPMGEPEEFPIYPPSLGEPYRSRRFKCGEDMYATIGLAREDKLARLGHLARNFTFFGAPVGFFFSIDRQMGLPQWAHMGMFMQTLMLAAEERGLATCAQEAWARWPQTIRGFLNLPEALRLYCGMALGYRDAAHPINSLRTDRAEVDAFATFVA